MYQERSNTKLIATLISLGVIAILVASCIGYNAWMQGEKAQKAAALLLEEQKSNPQSPENASTLQISSIDLEIPILWDYSEANLNTTVCKYRGSSPDAEGSLIIAGHDFLNGALFGSLNKVKIGDAVVLYDQEGHRYDYTVYENAVIDPNDVEALDGGINERELTLMTCSDNANMRLIVRCVPD